MRTERFVRYHGGRWWDRGWCWLSTVITSLRFGALLHGIGVSGHHWRESDISTFPGEHLECEHCGRIASLENREVDE